MLLTKELKKVKISKKICTSKFLVKVLLTILTFFIALLFLFPLIFVFSNSFMGQKEILNNYGILDYITKQNNRDNNFVTFQLIPYFINIKQYIEIIFVKSNYLSMFWNSCILTFSITFGQVVIASMAAYGFSKLEFKHRDKLFFVYIIIMLMPLQVTLIPNYIISLKLGLIGKYSSIILPGIFSAFGVVLLRQVMIGISDAYIEAAMLDGAGQKEIFFNIVIPLSKHGIFALAVLLIIDNWNMVELPLVLLNDMTKYPLSILLSTINTDELSVAFASSVLYMLPMIIIFTSIQEHLFDEISYIQIKS